MLWEIIMSKVLGIIPSRIGSMRLPRKPLIDIFGKSLIQRTYESCSKSHLVQDFIVATDSQEIFDHVIGFGGKVMMTGDCSSGTLRVIEVAQKFSDYDYFLNIQGDHPLLEVEHIDSLAIKLQCLSQDDFAVVTPIVKFQNYEEVENPNVVKVVFNKEKQALYFSRSIIPYLRDKGVDDYLIKYGWKHLGLYGFNKKAINFIKQCEISDLEVGESLEQLSWLYQGIKIYCVEVEKDVASVDTYQDLQKIRNILNGITK